MGLVISGITRHTGSLRLLADDRLLSHNLIVGAGTIVAGVLGVAFQSLVSHEFRPADYGSVFAMVTLITFVGLPASAFTLLMARETSQDMASGRTTSAALLRNGSVALLLGGAGLGIVFAAASPLLGAFLRIPPELLIAAAVAMPFSVAGPLLIGALQGRQRFVAFASLNVGQAGLKIAGAVGLGLLFGPVGIIAGISAASVVIYVTAFSLLRRNFQFKADVEWLRPAAKYVAVVLPSTLALAVLLSADVFLVKHYFSTRAAGEYSAVAALGRAIFWGASGVAMVMFPKMVFRRTMGSGSHQLLAVSLLLVAAGGLVGLTLLSLASNWLLTAFAGSAYVGAAGFLPWYAVGMTLLGGVAVLVAVHQSRGRAAFLFVLIPLTILESVLIAAFHQSPMQVIQVVDTAMALILFGLTAVLVVEERSRQPVAIPNPVATQTPAAVSANS